MTVEMMAAVKAVRTADAKDYLMVVELAEQLDSRKVAQSAHS